MGKIISLSHAVNYSPSYFNFNKANLQPENKDQVNENNKN